MEPLTYVTNLSKGEKNATFIAIGVFIFFYLIIRLAEKYFIPLIPGFITTEISSLVRWSPILIPVIFGLMYVRPRYDPKWEKDKNAMLGTVRESDDEILRKRMRFFLT